MVVLGTGILGNELFCGAEKGDGKETFHMEAVSGVGRSGGRGGQHRAGASVCTWGGQAGEALCSLAARRDAEGMTALGHLVPFLPSCQKCSGFPPRASRP